MFKANFKSSSAAVLIWVRFCEIYVKISTHRRLITLCCHGSWSKYIQIKICRLSNVDVAPVSSYENRSSQGHTLPVAMSGYRQTHRTLSFWKYKPANYKGTRLSLSKLLVWYCSFIPYYTIWFIGHYNCRRVSMLVVDGRSLMWRPNTCNQH